MANCFDNGTGGQLIANQQSLLIAPCDKGIYYDEFTGEPTFVRQEFSLFPGMQTFNITPSRTTETIRLANCEDRSVSTVDSIATPISFLYDPKNEEHQEFADPESFHQVNFLHFECPRICGQPDINTDAFRFGQILGGVDDLAYDSTQTTPVILTATMNKTGRPIGKRNFPGQVQATPIIPVLSVDETDGVNYGPIQITGVSGGSGTYTNYEIIITRRDQPDDANTIFISGSDLNVAPLTVFDQMGLANSIAGNAVLGDFILNGFVALQIDPANTDVRVVVTDSLGKKGTLLVGV